MQNSIDLNYIILISVVLVIAMIIVLLKVNIRKNSEETSVSMKFKKLIGILFTIVGGLPIIAYPFVLIANVMSLAALGAPGSSNNILDIVLMLGFLLITTAYPLIYIICIFVFFRKNKTKNIIIPAIPICIVLLIIAFFTWSDYRGELYDSVGNYRIHNVEIFKNTPAWGLALAVKSENVNSIQDTIKTKPELINYQDSKYGATPLLWAVGVRKYKSVEALLRCSADPNIPAKDELGTPLFVAVMKPWDNKYADDTKIIELLLKFNANPDKGYIGKDTLLMESETSPLHEAVYEGIEKTKALVDGGADINIKTKCGRTPAINALIDGSFYEKEAKSAEVAYYLIVEKKAKVSEPYFSRDEITDERERKKYFPVDLLRKWVSDLNSREYMQKKEVIDEFSRQGINYWETKIPGETLKFIMKLYPNSWQDFIKQY